MQEALLKKIITEYAGPDYEKLVELLFKKENVNEFMERLEISLSKLQRAA